jgi:hypothetical protein
MKRKTAENKYSDCHRGKGIYFRVVVVMVAKKQEIQDSGGGVWPSFAHRNCLHRAQETYNYKRKRICIYTTPAELRYYSYFMYLVSIYSTSSKSVKLGLECEASTKAQQI